MRHYHGTTHRTSRSFPADPIHQPLLFLPALRASHTSAPPTPSRRCPPTASTTCCTWPSAPSSRSWTRRRTRSSWRGTGRSEGSAQRSSEGAGRGSGLGQVRALGLRGARDTDRASGVRWLMREWLGPVLLPALWGVTGLHIGEQNAAGGEARGRAGGHRWHWLQTPG